MAAHTTAATPKPHLLLAGRARISLGGIRLLSWVVAEINCGPPGPRLVALPLLVGVSLDLLAAGTAMVPSVEMLECRVAWLLVATEVLAEEGGVRRDLLALHLSPGVVAAGELGELFTHGGRD